MKSKQELLEKFHADALVEFYFAEEHTKDYQEELVKNWRANSKAGKMQNAYKQALRRIGWEFW
jgi:hypothetical protein